MSVREPESALLRLRREFDDAFARPYAAEPTDLADLLEIRAAGTAYGLRLQQVEAMHVGRRLVKAPSARADLLGLANVRGVIAPVYDLALLLGHPRAERPRWLVLLRGAPFSVAFERFERQLRVPAEAILPAEADGPNTRSFSSGSVRTDSGPLPLLDLLALLRSVTSDAGHPAAPKREDTR